jgi:trehalose 6-phosphate phosphatase
MSVAAIDGALRILGAAPAALVTDIDGTISPIVPRPQDAHVTPAASDALRRLAARLALVAVVTAREAAVARRMVGVDGIVYVGNYALDSASTQVSPSFERAKGIVRQLLGPLEGITLEDKGAGLAIHYRNSPDPEAAHRQVLALVGPLVAEVDARVQEGKQVVELLPGSMPDKGTAVARLLARYGIRGAVYLGDDLSDVPVFREMKRRRAEGGLPSWSVAVVDAETPPAVVDTADQKLYGMEEVEAFLAGLASTAEEGGLQ